MRKPKLALVLVTALLASCSPSVPKVEVVTEPAGAQIYVNGERVGASPKMVTLPFDKSGRVWVQVSLAGFAHQDNIYTLPEVTKVFVIKLPRQ